MNTQLLRDGERCRCTQLLSFATLQFAGYGGSQAAMGGLVSAAATIHQALGGQSPQADCTSLCGLEDFDFSDGPREVTKPKFIRSEFPSLVNPVKISEPSGTSKRRRGRRPFRKATPLQAISGAVIGGGCSVLAFNAARQAYQHLEMHPPAHDLPLNLTGEVNQLMLTMVAGFGGLVVCMFGVSCVGLALLSVQLIIASKPPPSAP